MNNREHKLYSYIHRIPFFNFSFIFIHSWNTNHHHRENQKLLNWMHPFIQLDLNLKICQHKKFLAIFILPKSVARSTLVFASYNNYLTLSMVSYCSIIMFHTFFFISIFLSMYMNKKG